MKKVMLVTCFLLFCTPVAAAELSGVFLADEIKTTDGQSLVLNGAGLREKIWIDVYVGSLYLPKKSIDVAEILSNPGPWRVQMDFVYKEVSGDKLLRTWREGFEKNQSPEILKRLQPRIDQFYGYFENSAHKKDQYRFDYLPGKGTRISKNQQLLGTIAGEDFKNALLEIWLGNHPADRSLKQGMLGL